MRIDIELIVMGAKTEFLLKVKNGTISGEDVALFAKAVEELGSENEDLQELLEDIKEEGESFRINLKLVDSEATASMLVENGELKGSEKLLDNPTVSIFVDKDTSKKILSGRMGLAEAYKLGKLKAEGSLTKAAGLAIILNIVGDELGVY